MYWVDPDMFSVLRLSPVNGNLDEAVRRPDGIVLTESAARKYFGDANPLNQTIELDRQHVLRVTAVVRDVPDNSHFRGSAFASGRAGFSGLAQFDLAASAGQEPGISGNISLYLKLPRGLQAGVVRSLLPRVAQEFL